MSTKSMQWLMPKTAQNKPAYQAQPESFQDVFLPRSIAAKDWLLGVLAFLALMGVTAGVGRLFMGLQDATSLSDGVSWGIWIGFDFGLIAFAGRGVYDGGGGAHLPPGAVSQGAAPGAAGRACWGTWGCWRCWCSTWGGGTASITSCSISTCTRRSLRSAGVCCCTARCLMIEVSPDFLRFLPWKWPARAAAAIIVPVSIIGVTLSTLHQSTLGTLYLNMPYRLHALWYTPMLPILFYVSSIMAGLSLGILAYLAACKLRGVKTEARHRRRAGQGAACGWRWSTPCSRWPN